MDLGFDSNRYYRFNFCKSDYLLFSKVLHMAIQFFVLFRDFVPSRNLSKIISDLSELVWQLDTQVERQQFFDSL